MRRLIIELFSWLTYSVLQSKPLTLQVVLKAPFLKIVL